MACKRKGREFLYSPALLLALIHRSAWNKNSANFAFWAFSEVRRYGVLRSSRPEIATWHTKIRHLGDALHPATLVAYLCEVTRGQGPLYPSRSAPPISEGEGTW
jgi:hypothetical protein